MTLRTPDWRDYRNRPPTHGIWEAEYEDGSKFTAAASQINWRITRRYRWAGL